MVKYVPDAGDIAWLEFDPRAGREIQKKRPALTISPKSYTAKTDLGQHKRVPKGCHGKPSIANKINDTTIS